MLSFFFTFFFFFNDTATTEIYTLSLHDALPISLGKSHLALQLARCADLRVQDEVLEVGTVPRDRFDHRVAEGAALVVRPAPVSKLVGTVLHEHRHVVLVVRGHGRVDLRGN